MTWRLLLSGEHVTATDIFDRARSACEARVNETMKTGDPDGLAREWLNARSNDALNRLALGGPADAGLQVWDEDRPWDMRNRLWAPPSSR